MDEQPTEEDLELSVFSFYEWRKLGEQLEVSPETLDDIGYSHQTFQKKKATKATLLAWRQQKGSAATRKALIDALVATKKAEFVHAAAVYRAHCRTYAHRVGKLTDVTASYRSHNIFTSSLRLFVRSFFLRYEFPHIRLRQISNSLFGVCARRFIHT